MATYLFLCKDTQKEFELEMGIGEYSERKKTNNFLSPFTGKNNVSRLVSQVGIQFKGGGWTPKFYEDSTDRIRDKTKEIKEGESSPKKWSFGSK